MTTDVKSGEKILMYDGDCPMCTSTIALLVRAGLVQSEQTRSNHELVGVEFEAAQAAGIRNQLVVLDPQTRQTRSGSDGLLWIIRDNTGNHVLVRLLSLPGIRHLLRWGYETISYNRRIISPPRHRVVCDCEPEVTLARRLMLVVPALVATLVLTAWFGAAVFVGWELGDAHRGALFMEVAAGSGWMVLVVAAMALLRGERRVDYLSHLVVTMFVGVLVLLPACLAAPLFPRQVLVPLDCLSVLISFALMFSMQRRRVAAAGVSNRWLWAWVVALAAGSSMTATFYFWRTLA
jgi:predicted DCC family thiol-disulfide oxidoreductase YuxK